jgi:hypothetical protein
MIAGALLAAVVLLAWGVVYWAKLPFQLFVAKPLPTGDAVVRDVRQGLPETAVCLYPRWEEPETESEQEAVCERVLRQQTQGPLGQLLSHQGRIDTRSPGLFAQYFGSAVIVAGLLVLALPGLKCYAARVGFVFLAGLFAAVAVNFSQAIWFHQPWGYHLFLAAFHVSGWLLAGSVMALVIRPREGALAGRPTA